VGKAERPRRARRGDKTRRDSRPQTPFVVRSASFHVFSSNYRGHVLGIEADNPNNNQLRPDHSLSFPPLPSVSSAHRRAPRHTPHLPFTFHCRTNPRHPTPHHQLTLTPHARSTRVRLHHLQRPRVFLPRPRPAEQRITRSSVQSLRAGYVTAHQAGCAWWSSRLKLRSHGARGRLMSCNERG